MSTSELTYLNDATGIQNRPGCHLEIMRHTTILHNWNEPDLKVIISLIIYYEFPFTTFELDQLKIALLSRGQACFVCITQMDILGAFRPDILLILCCLF